LIEFAPIARFGLLLIRPGMLVMTMPVLGTAAVPAPVKIGLTVMLGIGILPAVTMPTGEVALTVMIAREMAIGLSLSFVLRALIAGAEFAGHLAGHQIGFSYGATVDPASGVRHTMIATLYGMMATVTFFAVNGHHALLRALAASYQGMPIGAGHINESLIESVRQTLALVFTVGLRLAAPILLVMLIVELVVGLIARSAPALNFMTVGTSIRLIIGLVVVAAVLGTVPGVTASLMDTVMALGLRTAGAFR
jgi:flagellar biosynthetic protein FliR